MSITQPNPPLQNLGTDHLLTCSQNSARFVMQVGVPAKLFAQSFASTRCLASEQSLSSTTPVRNLFPLSLPK